MIAKHVGQKGMTLLEITVSMAIASMITSGILGLIYHEVTTTATIKTSVTATHEITNAVRSISRDVVMANGTNLAEGAAPEKQLILNWMEKYDYIMVPHNLSYTLAGTELRRDYDGTVTTVARNISGIEFSRTANVITIKISCTPTWNAAEHATQKTFRVWLRTMEGG